nr:MAG TPA: hypothetical protein [Caudoviricetes sp.]DAX23230.1 MAG TPA: hypothetical protein [Caudoviricetes sp.]
MTMYVGYDKIRTVKKTALPQGAERWKQWK